ncbi:MAG: hypothetical protein AB8G26_17820 [Ilumatobacter sp.]
MYRRHHRSITALTGALLVAACSTGATPDTESTTVEVTVELESPSATGGDDDTRRLASARGRVDLRSSGNRWIEGDGRLTTADPIIVELPDDRIARWIVPDGTGWLAVLDDGSVVHVEAGRSDTTPLDQPGTFDANGGPPVISGEGPVELDRVRRRFSDPLPDTRVVTDGRLAVALTGPTGRYPHGVLGDAIEASSFEIHNTETGSVTTIRLDSSDVFEAVSPMLADVDEDGELDVVVTSANATVGARLNVFDLGGQLIAQSDAIGTGNRWRNLMAVAPVGPDGEVEVVDVQTPHIGGIVQFFRFDGNGRLERVATARSYSTHSIGSRNLDLGIVTDADGDGQLDVIVPTQDLRALAVLTRDDSVGSGATETFRFDLGDRLTTNVAAASDGGSVRYAVGTAGGLIFLW